MQTRGERAWALLRRAYAVWFFIGGFVLLSHQLTGQPAFPRVAPAAQALLDAFKASQFIYPLLAAVYLAGGAALFFRATAPLGLAMLAGPSIGIGLFHVLLSGTPGVGVITCACFALLAWRERTRIEGLWRNPAQ